VYFDREAHDFHVETKLPVMPYSPQANGFFSGKYSRPRPGDDLSGVVSLYGTEENFLRLDRAKELAAKLGCTANQIALAYLIAQPFDVVPIAGPHTPEQLIDTCQASDLKLTEKQVRYLESGGRDPGVEGKSKSEL
jgi:aryl-alcohol dehydrogenase-like predicted oxidoreductase